MSNPIKKKRKSKLDNNNRFNPPVDERVDQWVNKPAKNEDKKEEQFPITIGKSHWGGERVVLPDFQQITNKPPLNDGHISCLITGASGTGKSYILLSLIPCFNKLSQIMVCSLIIGNPVYSAIEQYCKLHSIRYGFASNPNDSMTMIETFVSEKPDGSYGLIIFDDFDEAASTSKNNIYTRIQSMASRMLRNMSVHNIFITQSYTNIPTTIRNNLTMLITFKMCETHAIYAAKHDFELLTGQSGDLYMKMYNRMIGHPHSYILCSGHKIYLFLNGVNDSLQEINPMREDESSLQGDKKLVSLIGKVKINYPKVADLNNLKRYIKILASENNIALDEMIDEINQVFDIELEL